jgi:iron(II)-dependent oxidoreductase
MGSAEDNPLASDAEKPKHTVEIAYDYWLARYPVTHAQFARLVEAGARKIAPDKNWSNKADHPVVNVTWHEALEYCNWLQTVSARPCLWPPGECACPPRPNGKRPRAATSPLLLAGETQRGCLRTSGRGVIRSTRLCAIQKEGGKKGTTPVGIYSPDGDSPFGLADMAGTVWEWTVSLWGLDLFRPQSRYPYQPQDGREKLDAPPTVYRVVRGGAFNSGRAHALRAVTGSMFARAARCGHRVDRSRLTCLGMSRMWNSE